jgi:protein-L-isoaspartate(D-aspartate) O-methyltransferase
LWRQSRVGADDQRLRRVPEESCHSVGGIVTLVDGEAAILRDRLVDELRSTGVIRSEAVERAFQRVPRHRLIGAFQVWDPTSGSSIGVRYDRDNPARKHLAVIYSDQALITRQADGSATSSSSMPSLMASMLEALELEPGMRVLEIGAGIGYNAALISEIVGDGSLVTTVDIDRELVEEAGERLAAAGYGDVDLRWADGFESVQAGAFDRIVATVGCPDLAPAWFEQLAPTGRLLIPLQHAQFHPVVGISASGEGRFLLLAAFLPASGKGRREAPWVEAQWRTESDPDQRPGWADFGSAPEWPGWGRPRDELDFLLFLSLRDRRAFDGPGVGLWEAADRWAAAKRDSILVMGDGPLAGDLNALHDDWLRREKPRVEDWRLLFGRSGEAFDRPGDALEVRRSSFLQLAWI